MPAIDKVGVDLKIIVNRKQNRSQPKTVSSSAAFCHFTKLFNTLDFYRTLIINNNFLELHTGKVIAFSYNIGGNGIQ